KAAPRRRRDSTCVPCACPNGALGTRTPRCGTRAPRRCRVSVQVGGRGARTGSSEGGRVPTGAKRGEEETGEPSLGRLLRGAEVVQTRRATERQERADDFPRAPSPKAH